MPRAKPEPEPEPEPLPAKLRRLRESAGLTQLALAHQMGVTQGWVGQVESSRRPASLETLHRFAVALKVDPSTLDERLASVDYSTSST